MLRLRPFVIAMPKLVTLVVVVPALCLVWAALPSGVALAATPVSGYEVVQSPPLAFGDGGFGGWSCPVGKTVLGGGFEATDPVSVSAPGTPGSVWPHQIFGPTESGWVVQDDIDGAGNTITIYVICANAPPGYEVVDSGPMVFGDGGYGGWSCPVGKVVLDGGFQALDPVAVSAPGTPGSVWPHHTFGPDDYGWVIRDDPNGFGNLITVYAICADAPTGYVVDQSPPLAFGDGGYGGWSCPTGKVLLGGGFDALDTVAVSAPGTPESVWPHHTFGPNEYGWVIQDDPNGAGNTITIYAICANVPVEGAGVATGGGQVPVAGGMASFGFNARTEEGEASGHLNYKNHVTGAHLNCTVTAFTELTPTTATFSGTCNPQSSASSFEAELEDNDEPGKGSDKFTITYNAMTEGGTLTAGNVQIRSEPAAAASSSGNDTAATGAGDGAFPSGASLNGVSINGLETGLGLSIAPDGAAAGTFVATLLGTSALGHPQAIEVDGRVTGGSVGPDGSVTLTGTAAVDVGDGSLSLLDVPFSVTATTDSLLLQVGTSTLPPASLTGGSITID
jgi:hypothetical protein